MLERQEYGIISHCKHQIHASKLEGVKNKIKAIERTAYGFHDLDYCAPMSKRPTEAYFQQLIWRRTHLIESRLSEVAMDAGCTTFSELYYKARYKTDKTLTTNIIDAITTNETLFFRDNSPFEALQHKAVPELIDARANIPNAKRLRIWSAACSTAQEPYSIAMTLRNLLPIITCGTS